MYKSFPLQNGRAQLSRVAACVVAALLLSAATRGGHVFGRAQTGRPSQVAAGTKAASPPLMTKLSEYLVIVPLPDGKLMGVFQRTVDGEQEAAARYSDDNGHSWGEPRSLFKFPREPKGSWGVHVGLLDQSGEIHLFYQNDAGTRGAAKLEDHHYDIWHTKTARGRTEWQPLKCIWKGYAGSMLSVTQMRNGRMLLPICYLPLPVRTWRDRGQGFDAFAYMGLFSSTVLYSDDGDTWHPAPVEFKAPTPIINADGMLEPGVIQLKDGRAWLLIRTQLGRFFESFSPDGVKWSPAQPTRILSSDSPGNLIRLKTGQLVMLWNNCLRFSYANGGRHVLHAAISDDEGRTWRGFREVARNPFVDQPPPPHGDHGVTYTVLTLARDGTVLTPLSTGMKDGTYLLHLDPAWLTATERKSDFADGLSDWSTFGTRGVELVPDPDRPATRLLRLRKAAADWPAAAVWNFPAGQRGSLTLRLMLEPGFRGVSIGLTDHFSVPFDPQDQIYNLFNLAIGPDGALPGGNILELGRWHRLRFEWDTFSYRCRVVLDGHQVTVLPLTRMSTGGVSYLRLRSTAESTDHAGLLVESVEAKILPER